MKKLNKLEIKPEKLINNEELLTLRGGYGGCEFRCRVREYYQGPILLEGDCCLSSAEECVIALANQWHEDTTCWRK
jgi:hypothetical protein